MVPHSATRGFLHPGFLPCLALKTERYIYNRSFHDRERNRISEGGTSMKCAHYIHEDWELRQRNH